jgi:hypothetical protein
MRAFSPRLPKVHWPRRSTTLASAAALLGIGAAAIALMSMREAATAATITANVPPAKAAALVQATSGTAATDM